MQVRVLLQSLYKIVHIKWITLNVFDSRTTDPLIIRREILSTRLYIILVLISLIIFKTYASLSQQNETKTVSFPSQSVYENLLKKYQNNLQCTCTKVLIPYEKFVKTIPSFHQVCSSDFISQEWIDFIFKADSTLIWPIDVRTSLSSMWQLIRIFSNLFSALLIVSGSVRQRSLIQKNQTYKEHKQLIVSRIELFHHYLDV
ncbi:hypothetical protein I4U23_021962 [Adineta vaga]|nr:hypothetical protein I4U23_021962 [Adineta vaga]